MSGKLNKAKIPHAKKTIVHHSSLSPNAIKQKNNYFQKLMKNIEEMKLSWFLSKNETPTNKLKLHVKIAELLRIIK